ncbi:facilitated trehalose transporter Tret1-like [Wyeomyia smithii]|uniref:facilitated trehalose transporter Tret1-like n=1 Tax=Wyeomyia smithii TaxID=174621 RepID=UPI002467D23C|nr:facilitated trehalose transporter Tret1-like [Wyeomyia smithii]
MDTTDVKKPFYTKQYIAAVIATLGAFSIGTIFGWSSQAEPKILNNGETDYNIEREDFAWAVALMGLGGAIISIPAGLIVKRLGARKTLLLFVTPTTVGWILIVWYRNAAMLLVGRLFTGFGAGAFCMIVPIYIGETASPEIRGTAGSLFQQMINLGILYAYFIGMVSEVFTLSILCGIVPIVYGALFFFMPETPTFLVLRNNDSQAVSSIKWLRGSHFDAAAEVDEIRSQSQLAGKADQKTQSVWQSFRQPATVRALVTMLGLMFFLQMSGVNTVLFYTTSIFQSANVVIDPELATIIIGGMQVLGTLVSTVIVDRAGRRSLLMVSGGAMMVSALAFGIYLLLLASDGDVAFQVAKLGWIPVAALCMYVTLFSVGLGPVPWLMLGEIFASDVKGPASALANMTSFGLSFVLSRLFPLAWDSIGGGPTFIIFAGFCFLEVVFVVLVVPETKGKSLGEVQIMLASR